MNRRWQTVGMMPLHNREDIKADVGSRTPDLLITSELLYQLSYVGPIARGNPPSSTRRGPCAGD